MNHPRVTENNLSLKSMKFIWILDICITEQNRFIFKIDFSLCPQLYGSILILGHPERIVLILHCGICGQKIGVFSHALFQNMAFTDKVDF